MRNVVVLKGDREKSIGLIGMSPIPPDTFFVFEDVRPGTLFHSRGVLEPFDIAFLDTNGKPIVISEVIPPDGLIAAPLGTHKVVESKAGYLRGLCGMGSMDPERDKIVATISLPLAAIFIGGIIVYLGYKQKSSPIGILLMGAGSSTAGVGIVIGIRNLLDLNP